MRQFINIVESHLTEIDRGNGDLADDDHWEQVKRGEFEPRQHDMFSNVMIMITHYKVILMALMSQR